MLQILIDRQTCNGCGICVEGCFVPCLEMDEETGTAKVADIHGCLVCRQCEAACPMEAIRVELPDWPRDPTQGVETIL